MIELTTDYKKRVVEALISARENYSGSDSDFSRKWGIDKTVYSRLKKGFQEGLLSVGKYIELGYGAECIGQGTEVEYGADRGI